MPLILIGGHCPHEGAEDACKIKYQNDLGALISRLKRKWPEAYVILPTDRNAKLGEFQSEYVGPFFPQKESRSGQLLRDLIQEHGIRLENTFHSGPGFTWVGS